MKRQVRANRPPSVLLRLAAGRITHGRWYQSSAVDWGWLKKAGFPFRGYGKKPSIAVLEKVPCCGSAALVWAATGKPWGLQDPDAHPNLLMAFNYVGKELNARYPDEPTGVTGFNDRVAQCANDVRFLLLAAARRADKDEKAAQRARAVSRGRKS